MAGHPDDDDDFSPRYDALRRQVDAAGNGFAAIRVNPHDPARAVDLTPEQLAKLAGRSELFPNADRNVIRQRERAELMEAASAPLPPFGHVAPAPVQPPPAPLIGPVAFDLGPAGTQFGWYDRAEIQGKWLILAFAADAPRQAFVPPLRKPPEEPIRVSVPGLQQELSVYHVDIAIRFAGYVMLVFPINRQVSAQPAPTPTVPGEPNRGW